MRCTRETISRERPSRLRLSSCSMSKMASTPSYDSACMNEDVPLKLSAILMSPPSSVCPHTSIEPFCSKSLSSLLVSLRTAADTSFMAFPRRLPRAALSGSAERSTMPPSSVVVVSSRTLSSSLTYASSSLRSSSTSLSWQMAEQALIGLRSEMPLLSRAFLPFSTKACMREILSSIRSFIASRLGWGKGRWWMLSACLSSGCRTLRCW
mmetsp:Transcript_64713/g.159262  ORF Transcript_64713/g.159262 Transcript_64713/m.159262 type:complete len:209 (+) Transcript_64713:868-1494(+)